MSTIKKTRKTHGSILLLMVFVLCFIVVPALIMAGQIGLYQVDKSRAQDVVEAAGLVAANDLSRIIINDPKFGYVSLSNYPPIGKGTCAADGEPLPVLGINALIGTIRQNIIVANELNNATMTCLVDADKQSMDSTIKTLNKTLQESLLPNPKSNWSDIEGTKVEITKDVTNFLKTNLPKGLKLQSVKLSNGWLEGGSDSMTNLPQPERLAQVKAEANRSGKYRAFTNVPAAGRTFTFAGLGKSSSLVSLDKFKPADSKHICSIVKIEVTIERSKDLQSLSLFGLSLGSVIQQSACCQPYSMPESGPAGALTLRFSGGPVPGLQSWHDFLAPNFTDSQINTYQAAGGDYPTDQQAQMIKSTSILPPTTSEQFAEHFYYWLRNGHTRPNIDSIMEMVNASFSVGPAQIYAYEFCPDGKISRRIISRDPFPIGVTADNQVQAVADTNIQGGISPIIIFRNNVANLGTARGGVHGGQPLAGYPLNWCELTDYGGDEHMASGLGKGRLGTRLSLVDGAGTALPDVAINDPNFALFQTLEGKTLTQQPRRSFYSGGLALDIEIGGTSSDGSTMATAATSPPAVPTLSIPSVSRVLLPPILDIPNKRYIFANRRI